MDPDPNPRDPEAGELAVTIAMLVLVVFALVGSCGLACRVFQIASGS